MTIYAPKAGMYDYKHLPKFAAFLLRNHLDEFVKDQVALSRELQLPLLKHLTHLSDQQLIDFGTPGVREYLQFLSRNQAEAQITESLTRWLNDKLSIIGKFDIGAEDITVMNYMRGQLFRKWIKVYEVPEDEKFDLLQEVETFLFGSITTATNNFINILKEKIQEESHFNEQLINTSPGIIFIFDLEKNKEVYINGNVEGVMGYTKDEILGMESTLVATLTHPDDVAALQDHLVNLLQGRIARDQSLEYRFRHKNGTYKWLRTYNMIFKTDAMGKPTQVLGTSFEITRERETAEALATRESQLLEAQSIAQLGSYEWDIVKNTSANTPELVKIFELDKEPPGFNFISKVHPDDCERVQREMTQSFITGNYDCQYRYMAPSGEKFLWVRGVVHFFSGKPIQMRGTVQDITQLKKIEEELVKKTKELERSNESLQQFASIASHDLKEPLRKMSMYTDMVLTTEQSALSESSQVNLQKVKSSSIRMQNMIDDILNFSTLTHGESKKVVQLGMVLREAISILEESIQEKKVIIRNDTLPEMFVIASQIRQLFQNLLSNAIKFSKKDQRPLIEISHQFLTGRETSEPDLEPARRYISIKVSDNGIGFKPEHREKIFGLFTRLHGRSAYDGSGLGLAICKRIVENHNGKITAESQPGEGATFKIYLPLEAST